MAHFTGSFRFFDLPRELRDMVYDEAWPLIPQLYRATLLFFPSPLIDITARYRKTSARWTTSPHTPYWFLGSRKFLDEAPEQYYRGAVWKAIIPASYFATRIWLSSSYFKDDARAQVQWEMDALLGNPRYPLWMTDSDYSRTKIELYKAWPTSLPILRKLYQGLREATGLRALHVTFGVTLRRATGPVAVDLSGLEHIGFKLDKLVVDLVCDASQCASHAANTL